MSFLENLEARAKSVFQEAQEEANAAIDKISAEAEKLGNSEIAQKILKEVNELHSKLDIQAKEFADEKIAIIKQFEAEKRQQLAGALSKKLSAAIAAILNILVVKIKEAIDDPYMPRFVKNSIDLIIDAIWPDVSDNIREEILEFAHPDKPFDHGEPGCCGTCCGPMEPAPLPPNPNDDHCCCCQGCCCEMDCTCYYYGPIAWIRYRCFGYDRSIWRMIRDPWWWLLTIVSCIPKWGVSTAFYIFLFLVTDKDDEFQLVQFIRSFKALQFVSVGCISTMIGGGMLAVCTQPAPSSCFSYSPMEQLHIVALFIIQIFVCWAAFLFLPGAKNKGGLRFQISQIKANKLKLEARDAKSTVLTAMATETVESAFFEEQLDGAPQRNRLFYLLMYDTIVFLLCAGLVAWAAFGNLLDSTANVTNFPADDSFVSNNRNWKFQAILYWTKCAYGLLSFPFLILVVPGISALFTHSKKTGYNVYGNTVPFLGEEQENVPWRRRKTPEEVARDKAELERREEARRQKFEAMEAEEEQKRLERTTTTNRNVLAQSGNNNNNGTSMVHVTTVDISNLPEDHYYTDQESGLKFYWDDPKQSWIEMPTKFQSKDALSKRQNQPQSNNSASAPEQQQTTFVPPQAFAPQQQPQWQ